MEALLTRPYEHLVQMLAVFAGSMRSSMPTGGQAEPDRWSRAASLLDRELRHLRSFAPSPQASPISSVPAAGAPIAALKSAAVQLTQLARTQDGLRLDHSAAASFEQLAGERRLVVLAAWQLLQALEQLQPLAVMAK